MDGNVHSYKACLVAKGFRKSHGVKTIFLNRNLMEDGYLTQPEGFVDPKNANKVCKVQRSIYGLRMEPESSF
ncbi:Retrovirus-related Pol polyprotein from transposon TNT 1-94 [Cucumis melo var. makuwa]|uniref:Retrovirus-related Pol polyprotein from transposon TNT 1-94 n=1 Tax=Cucumis melo var. makuwa TaxID=1194695 RepID=A0A5D3BNS8_CUCMM|nr:Retrovirus-related Pol polyprotein from transposon TNT 1-94 [Cucumis melo var. makuwa]TYK00884.1 Retrovirus-related Pol polyprotein from transposon TNT 1-94 [Cucumis melo var. makuwa]